MDEFTFLLWGTRAFVGGVSLLLAALLLACWWWIAGIAFAELWRSWRAGDLWLAFLPNERGEWGPLASNRWWNAHRASERGSAKGLAWRWGFWMFQAAGLTFGVAYGLWGMGRMLVLVWV